jgi:PKD repeat protein
MLAPGFLIIQQERSMNIIFSNRRIAPLVVLSLVTSLGALLSAPLVHAKGSYVSTWSAMYPSSMSEDNSSCQLCHAASTQDLNSYGEALCSSNAGDISNRIAAVEAIDSDMDPTGASNITETNASTQPGWTSGNVNPTYSRGDCAATGLVEAPPTFIPGNIDPATGNQSPVADANGPYSGTVGVPLTLDGTASNDPDGTIVAYSWDFGDGNTGSGVTPTHTYMTGGSFTVALTVTDDIGDTGMATSTATIGLGNQPPVADPNGPYTGMVGVAVAFDGSASNDPDGRIISYSWDFGDGATGSGMNPPHTYASAGVYNVTLTVMDDAGATGSLGTTAEIMAAPVNQPPVSDPNGPYTGTTGIAVTFDGTGSHDPDGTIVAYSWDFGDGNTGTGSTPSHAYGIDGNYTVSLTVTDDAGATGTAMTTASISAVNQPPVADANGPYSGTVGMPLTFDGTASNDPDGTIVAYSWDFGDGNTGSGVAPTHTYMTDGSFTVTLTVTDDVGDTGMATSTATIGLGNQPPVADPNGPYVGTVGAAVQFDGSASNDPDGSIISYSWDFGDGNSGSGPMPSHTYATANVFNVTLTVMDDAGATGSAGTKATITPVADVFLRKLQVPRSARTSSGRTVSKGITVVGAGVSITQDATVDLSASVSGPVTVVVSPGSITDSVSDGNGSTRYKFRADITCNAAGAATVDWMATISAAQNSDATDDTLRGSTSVICR